MTPDKAILAFLVAVLAPVLLLWGATAALAGQCAPQVVALTHHKMWGLQSLETKTLPALTDATEEVQYDLWAHPGTGAWLLAASVAGVTCAMARGENYKTIRFNDVVARIRGEPRL